MSELTDWLSAQLDADEAAARAATPGPWRDMPMGSEGSDVQAGGNTITTARRPARCREFADATHIALHDPARVLVEVEAKRAIVAEHAPGRYDVPTAKTTYGCFRCITTSTEPCRTVRLLALPYAGHPDYRQEWKP